jgi:hypothetical protein
MMMTRLANTPTRALTLVNRKDLLLHLRQRNGRSENAAANLSPNPWYRDGRVSDQPHRGQRHFTAIALNLQMALFAGAGIVEQKSNRPFRLRSRPKQPFRLR